MDWIVPIIIELISMFLIVKWNFKCKILATKLIKLLKVIHWRDICYSTLTKLVIWQMECSSNITYYTPNCHVRKMSLWLLTMLLSTSLFALSIKNHLIFSCRQKSSKIPRKVQWAIENVFFYMVIWCSWIASPLYSDCHINNFIRVQ